MISNKFSSERIFLLLAVIFTFFVTAKLFYLQIVKKEFYYNYADKQSNAGINKYRDRGLILDSTGKVLAKNKKTASISISGTNIDNPESFIDNLKSKGIPVSSDVAAAIRNKKNFIWLQRHMDISKAHKLKEVLPFIKLTFEDSRFYPEGATLSGVIGYTGVDNQGLAGVEYVADSLLTGKKVSINTVRDSMGGYILYDDKISDISADTSVYLSIDLSLQSIVDEILKSDVGKFGATKGIAVVMDVHNGEIIVSSAVKKTNDKISLITDKNMATTYLFEPGSIFKVVTFGYLVENNNYFANSKVDASKPIVIAGHSIKDPHPYGILTQKEVFTKSSNRGTVILLSKTKNQDYYNYISNSGFGKKLGVYGAVEEGGILRDPSKWSKLSLASLSFGQEIMVTPIQILSYYSAIANDGVAYTPTFIKGIKEKDKYISYESNSKKIMNPNVSKVLMDLLSETVISGTGKKSRSNIINIGGKTGTAQLFDHNLKAYSKSNYVASFAGVFPFESPRFAMIVIYENPQSSIYGGSTGSETFKKIAEQFAFYYNLGIANQKVASNVGR